MWCGVVVWDALGILEFCFWVVVGCFCCGGFAGLPWGCWFLGCAIVVWVSLFWDLFVVIV